MPEQQLAEKGLDTILRAGFDKAACRVVYTELHELCAENGEINLLRTNMDTRINLSGIIDERRAALSVNKTDADAINAVVSDMKMMAKGGNPDSAFDIAKAQPSETFHTGTETADYDTMYERLRKFSAYAKENYPILLLRSHSASFVLHRSCFTNSNGVLFNTSRGTYHVGASYCSKDEKQISSIMWDAYSAFDLNRPIHASGHVDLHMKQSTEQITTRPVPAKFTGDMVIAPECLPDFIDFIARGISDTAIISGTSIFKDKMNQQVADEPFSLHCRPAGGEIVSGYFITDDGHKACDSTIIENGVLKSFLLSLYGANKTGLGRGANMGGCYVVEPGRTPLEDIISNIRQGILLTRFSGCRPNNRGDFSGVAKNSYYVADGNIQYPISETTVSGNIANLLLSIKSISKERLNSGRTILPYVHVSGVIVS